MTNQLDYKEIIFAIGDAVVVSDSEGLIRLWNPSAEKMFGFSSNEAIGQSLDIITPKRHQNRHWEGYKRTMSTGVTKYGDSVLRVPANRKDGRSLSIAFTVSLIFDQLRNVSLIVAVIRDESEQFEKDREFKRRILELELLIKVS
mgnify:CR=1 FL=1